MSERVEVQYRDLLTPIKDPEKSFCVNISELLQSYITNFVQGRIPPNFNSAALLLQGSSSIYAKKVEYLHNLASQLYQILVKNKKEESSKKTTKEREKNNREKENKLNDPFFSIEIKPGKNLSALRRKKISTSNVKKGGKKTDGQKFIAVPVDLLPLDGEEKGSIFYDTRGDMVGNKNDFALNKCRVTTGGWLLLPTISPESVPSLDAPLDYSNEFSDDGACGDMDVDDCMPHCTPSDEGYAGESPSSTPASSQEPCSQPLTEDEGLGSLPCTPDDNPQPSADVDEESPFPVQGTDLESPTDGIENVPMECVDTNIDQAVKPVRRSMRQALKLCQLEQQNDEMQNEENEDVPEPPEKEAVKKAIQKKNTCNLPSKLKAGDENMCITPASGYCARTFFSMDNKIFKGAILKCGVTAFGINSKLCKRLGDHYELMSTRNRNKKKIAEILVQEEDSVDVVGLDDIESVRDAAPDVAMETPLDDEDIVVTNDPIFPPSTPDLDLPDIEDAGMSPPSPEDPEIDEGMLIESFSAASHHLITNALTGIDKNADISRKVHEWERTIKPYLDELDHREPFDINLYGSRILNSFEESNRKQTTTFKNFCKGKEKWEVHRYFMALLPLVNIGNVSIESGTNNTGEEDIFVTLLSRKMHHTELEEFGHNEGGHS